MGLLYNSLTTCASGALRLAASLPIGAKTKRSLKGQIGAIGELKARFKPQDGRPVVWFHGSSLGEYAIIKPLIARLKERRPDTQIVLTFFSSTGVEALRRRPNPLVDFCGYLPHDQRKNARNFLEAMRPSAAVFAVSEYWPNLLEELRRRAVPTFLVSAIFTHRAPHYRAPLADTFRRSLMAYTRIFCLTKSGVANLKSLGFDRAELVGDPLMDNALATAAAPWSDPVIEKFCAGKRVLIAGSISDEKDMLLIAAEVNANPGRHYILVPHEVDQDHLRQVEATLKVPSARLSDGEVPGGVNVLIIDNIGTLSRLYRYGAMAYIGGGFSSKLHSLMEATVYGLPVSFGPRTERKITPAQTIALGIGEKVATPGEFRRWADRWFAASDAELAKVSAVALDFCRSQAGATDHIVTQILNAHD